jgi:hypothetical protein
MGGLCRKNRCDMHRKQIVHGMQNLQTPYPLRFSASSLILQRGRSSVWLERLPVTQEVASSNLVGPANLFNSLRIAVLIYLLHCSDFCSDPVTSLDSFNDSVQSKLFQLSCR